MKAMHQGKLGSRCKQSLQISQHCVMHFSVVFKLYFLKRKYFRATKEIPRTTLESQ